MKKLVYMIFKLTHYYLQILFSTIRKAILLFFFIFVFSPLAILLRLFGYDPLNLKRNNLLSYRKKKKISSQDLRKLY